MRMTKKITSIVLAVLMVVSMMSVMAISASAAGENFEVVALGDGATGAVGDQFVDINDAMNAAGDNGSIKLIADMEFDGNSGYIFVNSNKSTTFDLNGHKITSNNTSGINLSSTLPGVATFTVKDSSSPKTGEIITTVNPNSPFLLKTRQGQSFRAKFLLIDDDKNLSKKVYRTYLGIKYQGGYSDHLPVYIDLYRNKKSLTGRD